MSLEVHIDWQGQTHLVGRLYPAEPGPSISFEYAPEWLQRNDAFAIDPTSLPLHRGPHHGKTRFGAMQDCGPDRWGRVLIKRAGNRCQHTGRVLRPDEGSMDHVLPRSRGGKNAWENLVWAGKDVNARKGNRLPHEAGLKLLSTSRAPKELPATALIRNAHGIPEWKLFVGE
jgi:5-methylcytosine-specific restriction endonuclease McrA